MEKKGELTTQQIVLLIVLIISFAVILFFLFRLNLGEGSEKEICHNSVVTRGNPALSGTTSLNCKRSYVCITKDGSCEKMTNPEVKKVESVEEIYQVLADEMAECWWMFGEGKINYVGKDFKSNLYCSVCSQVLLDDSLGEIEEINESKIDEKEFYEYLEKEKISEDESYLEYLTGLGTAEDIESSIIESGGSFGDYKLNEQYFVMMGIYSEVGVWKWVAGGVIVGGLIAAPFTGGLSVIATASLVGGAAIGGGFAGSYLGTVVKGDAGYEFLTPVILEANSEEFEVFNCKDISTLS